MKGSFLNSSATADFSKKKKKQKNKKTKKQKNKKKVCTIHFISSILSVNVNTQIYFCKNANVSCIESQM